MDVCYNVIRVTVPTTHPHISRSSPLLSYIRRLILAKKIAWRQHQIFKNLIHLLNCRKLVSRVRSFLQAYRSAREAILLNFRDYNRFYRTLYPFLRDKGLQSDVKNYRPIDLTKVLSKVLKHIIKTKLLAHISANHLQDPNQHSFVSKCSVVSSLLISDSILTKSLDSNIPVDVIFLF